MLETLSVALNAMRLGNIHEGDSVGIIGTGMIGISAAQWAKMLGAGSVTLIGRSEAKRELVESCNINYYVSTDIDTIGQYNIVLEAVGSPSAIKEAIYATAPGGTVIFMGNPSGDIKLKQDTYWRILRKQLKITGTWNSSYDGVNPSDWTMAVSALADQRINVEPLISHCFPQERLSEGLELMREHQESYCKIMTIWNE